MLRKIFSLITVITTLQTIPIKAIRITNDSHHVITISNIQYASDHPEGGTPCLVLEEIKPYSDFSRKGISSCTITIAMRDHKFQNTFSNLTNDMLFLYGNETIHNWIQSNNCMPIHIIHSQSFMSCAGFWQFVIYQDLKKIESLDQNIL